MNVVYDDRNNHTPLTPAGLEALRQFEASPQDGQVLFHPKVADGQPAPDCVAFIEQVGRFAVTIMEGRYTVIEDGQWLPLQADGAHSPIDPLERAWQAAKAVRAELKRELGLKTYVIAVAWFPDMDEDQGEDILDETGGSSVRMLFGQAGLAQRLANLPKEEEVQAQLSRRFIQREVEALSPAPAAEAPAPDGETQPPNGRAGALIFQHVDTVNIYVTVVNGSVGDDPSLITVQGQ